MSLKIISFSADEKIIRLAKEKALHEKKSLDIVFRELLSRYVGGKEKAQDYRLLMKKLSHVRVGKKHFSREKINER